MLESSDTGSLGSLGPSLVTDLGTGAAIEALSAVQVCGPRTHHILI